MTVDGAPQPPVALGPYTVEYLGRRLGLRVLRVLVGRHTLDLFATLDGIAANVTAELDGRKLMRRRRQRPWRRWSNVLYVQRWIIAAAAEVDEDGAPRWSCPQIAENLKASRHGRRDRIEMSYRAVRALIWRLAPALAKRRTDYWRFGRKIRKGATEAKKRTKNAQARAAQRQAVIAEMRRAGLI